MDRRSEKRKREQLRRNIEKEAARSGTWPCGCQTKAVTAKWRPYHRRSGFHKSGTWDGTWAAQALVKSCPLHRD